LGLVVDMVSPREWMEPEVEREKILKNESKIFKKLSLFIGEIHLDAWTGQHRYPFFFFSSYGL